MDFVSILQKASDQYRSQQPFVLFALPNDHLVSGLFQNKPESATATQSFKNGFVLAPFNSDHPTVRISHQSSEILKAEIATEVFDLNPVRLSEDIKDRNRYLSLVQKAKATIQRDKVEKIVVSRKKELPLKEFNLVTLGKRLFSLQSDAFKYLWYHPTTGMWCGATPEVLLEVAHNNFTTMALAGTKKLEDNEQVSWTEKERHEQQLVTDSILQNLDTVALKYQVSPVYTQQAGHVAHLRTDIRGTLKNAVGVAEQLAGLLHPTPAVCGTPKASAKTFIQQHEGYDRAFYTGFLGPVQEGGNHKRYFVNLRCMQLTHDRATLYAGGGVMAGSHPESEWEETRHKLQTMAKLLAPFL